MHRELQREIRRTRWFDGWRGTFVVGIVIPIAVALALTAYIMPR